MNDPAVSSHLICIAVTLVSSFHKTNVLLALHPNHSDFLRHGLIGERENLTSCSCCLQVTGSAALVLMVVGGLSIPQEILNHPKELNPRRFPNTVMQLWKF